jgi:hypothetical protein
VTAVTIHTTPLNLALNESEFCPHILVLCVCVSVFACKCVCVCVCVSSDYNSCNRLFLMLLVSCEAQLDSLQTAPGSQTDRAFLSFMPFVTQIS